MTRIAIAITVLATLLACGTPAREDGGAAPADEAVRPDREEVASPPPRDPADLPRIDGVVTAVDPEKNVVVLSVGRDDRVRPGYRFIVYRGDRYVARIVVDRVGEDTCAGHSQKEVERTPIRVGDKVATRL